jgi:PKD repeat protein
MACNFQLQAQLVGTTVCQWSLPNFVTSNFKQLPNPYTYTLSTCTTATFTAPPIPTLAPVCGAASFQYSSFVWDFGDPASGASNTSSLTNVSHQFTSSGNFTVKLILKGNCTNDTLRQRITIPNPLQISNASTVCAGANVILQASGASNFSWNTGSPNSSISVQPATTTTYVVTGTVSPACVMTKSVLVTVSKCSSINEWTTKDKKLVYPNPFTDELTIEIQQASELVVMDALGRIVLRNAISTGIQVVNTEELPAGIYFIKLQNPNGQEIFRRVKVD